MQLRPYQLELVKDVGARYASGARSVVLQLGTGGGKTATASELLRRAVAKGRRCAFLAHLDALVEDTHERLIAAGVGAGFVQAGRPSMPSAPVQVCSLGTLASRPEEIPPADFVVLDECHRAMAATVREVLAAYPRAKLLGLTATPQRGDGKPLGDVFEQLVMGPSVKQLTADGHLVPCDLLAPANATFGKLASHPVEAYERWTPGKRALVFAGSVAHAAELLIAFAARGVSAACLTGDTPRADRRSLRDRLVAGELQVLVGVDVFTEGWDCPPVEAIVLASGVGVTGAFLQKIGRGLRPSPATGKTRCTVLDLAGSVLLHGLPDEDRRWSLEGRAVVRTEPIKSLARCTECLAIFRPARDCPRCGARAMKASHIPRVLARAEKLEQLSGLPQHEIDRRYLWTLRNVARRRMRLPPYRVEEWALKKFREKWGRDPETLNAAAKEETNG